MLEDNNDIEIEISTSESINKEDSGKSANKLKPTNNPDKQKKDSKKKQTSDGVEKLLCICGGPGGIHAVAVDRI